MKLNFSPYAFPYNGSQADIFSNDNVHEFNKSDKVQLCSIAVKNQVISLFGGEINFNLYLADNDGKFISATNDARKYITCCHPEALLNSKYHNANTPGYAIIWDEIYTSIRSFFGNADSCQEAANIINAARGKQSFKLMKLTAREKNKRNSARLFELSAIGQHPWQQPEFIKRARMNQSKRQIELRSIGQHNFQQPEFIKRERVNRRKRQIELRSNGQHSRSSSSVFRRDRSN
jgi:hypothetical protein